MDWIVIIPTHNEGRELQRTVTSVIEASAQYEADVEVYVGDDASDDLSAEAVRDAAHVIRHDQRLGVCGNKRDTYRIARDANPDARYALFVDSHSRLDSVFFHLATDSIIQDTEAGYLAALYTPEIHSLGDDAELVESEAYILGQRPLDPAFERDYPEPRDSLWPYDIYCAMGGATIAICDLYDEIGGYSPWIRTMWGWEDWDISLAAWLLGQRVRALPGARVWHKFRDRFPYGGYDPMANAREAARLALTYFTPRHIALMMQAQGPEFQMAVSEMALDHEEMERIHRLRSIHTMDSEELHTRFRVDW